MSRVLVIDDESAMRFTLEAVLGDAGFDVHTADGGAAGIAHFEAQGADVVITDLAMPDIDGMKVLAALRVQDPSVPVMMLTAHGSERVAVTAMKAGAFDYIPKPFDPDELVLAVKRAAENRALRLENARLRTEASLRRPIVAESPAIRRVLDVVTRVAPKDVTVLLTGESGVGKDVLAATLHAHSKRAAKPLVRFNAAAIPAELAEGELFGHMKGAFTGAHAARLGYFQQADKGTLFIDEIGELPLAMQAKVLRTIQSGEVQPVGGRTETVDVRLVVATNRDLAAEAKAGRFREDLFYRLNVVPIRVPPLRERPEDIEPLVTAFVRTYADRYGMGQVDVEPALVDAFKAHNWPGNVRELLNAVEHAAILCVTPEVMVDDLPGELREKAVEPGAAPAAPLTIDELEKQHILRVLRECGGHRGRSADVLGINRRTLYRKLLEYGVAREAGDDEEAGGDDSPQPSAG
jgi:two-component system, NtrC family, response regulator AtoC